MYMYIYIYCILMKYTVTGGKLGLDAITNIVLNMYKHKHI